MRTFTAHTTAASAPHEVLDRLTDPVAIARGAPVPFEVLELDAQRLNPGANVRVRGQLPGQGPSSPGMCWRSQTSDSGSSRKVPSRLKSPTTCAPAIRGRRINASISVLGHGLLGRLLAKATEALLAAGALRSSLNRLANQPDLAIAG